MVGKSGLLEKRLPKQKAEALSALLCTGQFTHDFPITVELAKSFDLPIKTDMPESIYSLMDLYLQAGVGRPSVNYVPLRKPVPESKPVSKGLLY